jgi:hypothetical protein
VAGLAMAASCRKHCKYSLQLKSLFYLAVQQTSHAYNTCFEKESANKVLDSERKEIEIL